MTEKIAKTPTLRKIFEPYGTYHYDEKCVYLIDNYSLQDEVFIKLCKEHKVKIQLDLFSETSKTADDQK